jgi:hypothetical protein
MCNNRQGTRLDSHLVRAMTAIDGLDGRAPISMALQNKTGRVAGNLIFEERNDRPHVSMRIVGKASNPAAIKAMPAQLFPGATLDLT